ncbi:hypothetical protein D3C77_508650 [compost metagenome]
MANQIVDGAQRFVQRRLWIVAMAIENIHVIVAKAFQAGVDLFDNMLARQSAVVRPFAHGPKRFRSKNIGFARISLQRFPYQFFCGSLLISIGCIKKVNPQIVGGFNRVYRVLAFHVTPICKPAAQADFADFEPTSA